MARNALPGSSWIVPVLAGCLLACGGQEAAEPVDADASAAGELWPAADSRDAPSAPAHSKAAPSVSPHPEELHAARAEVERLGAAVTQAESDLEAANAALSVARDRLARLRAATPRWPDAQIFRNVQRRMLTDPALSHVAISAEVRDGSVTLSGVVPNERTRRAAVRIAESVEGVLAVDNQITLSD